MGTRYPIHTITPSSPRHQEILEGNWGFYNKPTQTSRRPRRLHGQLVPPETEEFYGKTRSPTLVRQHRPLLRRLIGTPPRLGFVRRCELGGWEGITRDPHLPASTTRIAAVPAENREALIPL